MLESSGERRQTDLFPRGKAAYPLLTQAAQRSPQISTVRLKAPAQ